MKNSKLIFALLVLAACLYLGYKVSGKPLLAILAVFVILIIGFYTIIYDFRHDSFPWKKTAEGKRAEAQHRMEKAKAKEDKLNKRRERSESRKVAYMERMTGANNDDSDCKDDK